MTVTFSSRIKLLRARRGLTQAILAERAGVTLAYIGRLETGHYDPQLSTLRKLAKALKVSVAELTNQRGEGRKIMLSAEQIISGIESVTGDTPNSKIEELIFGIARMKREGILVPKTGSDYENWDWVQFEIHRRLKKEIKKWREEG